jgi:hypothetical protein
MNTHPTEELMRNKSLRRVLASVASTGLALAGFSAVATPAQAADPVTTTFKVHLNVPASVAADWNIWWWGVTDAGGPVDNTIGESTQTVAGVPVTKDWTPNFVGEDAYGSYAEFTVMGSVTALNNVLRTTESWDGQDAAPEVPAVPEIPEVLDDPATADVDESAPAVPAVPAIPAKVAIPGADKPLGGDNIFPAGESWWNVGTGKQEFPLKDLVDYRVNLNMPLAKAQANGWSLHTWGPYTPAQKALSTFKVVTPVTKTVIKTVYKVVKGKKVATKVPTKVTTNVTTYPYKGKVGAAQTGVPFSGSTTYGSYAVIKLPRVYVQTLGFLVKRSSSTVDWNDATKSVDFKSETNNGVAAGSLQTFVQMGSSYLDSKAPLFTARLTATATYANGTITVTPVFPSAPSLRGALPDSIVVTAKKGATTKTCTIANTYNAAVLASANWALASSCEMTGFTVPTLADGDATWDIFVQGTSTGVGKAALGPQRATKIVITAVG